MKPKEIGSSPFSVEDLKSELEEFAALYQQRPIKDNDGGMKAPQMFAAWYAAKKLKPSTIIESGVWYGQGTWFFHQASPYSQVICIEPELERIKYRSPAPNYRKTDFNLVDWSKERIDPETTLCFFDDHQDAISRLLVAKKWGFKHLMFEDNYPVTQGDCRSLKTELELPDSVWGVTAREHLKTYYEFPPVVKLETTRWGDPWTNDVYPTHDPLITEYSDKMKVFFDGADNYTWICYAELK